MIKNIIFDLGNIVVPSPNFDMVKQFFENESDAITFTQKILGSELWEDLDLGKMTMIEAARLIKNQKLIDIANYDEVEKFMLNWFSMRTPNEEIVELGKKLKNVGYKIFILSNMSKESFEYLLNKYDFFSMVDGAVVSAYEKTKKPESKIFEILLNRYSLIPEECVLIDDTKENLKKANEFGIKGRSVIPNDYQDIINLLKENNVL